MLIGSLQRSIEALARSLDQRTHLSQAMRQGPPDMLPLLYFGLPQPNGNVDDTFPDSLTAMTVHIDECLYFSELLTEILAGHGAALRKAYGRKAPMILEMDYTDPRIAPLMPDRSGFTDFEEQFRGPKKPVGLAKVRGALSVRLKGVSTWLASILRPQ